MSEDTGQSRTLRSPNPLGIFICASGSDEQALINCDAIYIYRDERQRLAFNWLFDKESNHNWFHAFEEGLVQLAFGRREIYFEVRRRYEWNSGGGQESDDDYYRLYKYRQQQSIDIFRLLEQTEMAFASQDNHKVYRRIGAEGAFAYRSAKELEEKIVGARVGIHEDWEEKVEQYIRAKLAKGVSVEEIASRCGMRIEDVRT